ncbi:AAA family ATPase [Pararcticibacter amylolyticus]|uniref:ATPase AAA-type core domain-containing protein n=1 Tax=Pararcticibacter amylolyticus TaxID=2173175 RepID=A0A2U2P9K1_9SPHI|nr:AAA family ATPase [Pararcticibacter amylolyticus]PWG78053.1 hypothetical protein DDR33_24245 [Pararcticibacter amylolyticus]
MELHYIWIRDFKNIKEQGFSFSDRYRITYDPDQAILDIAVNPNYFPNFFPGKISSVTGIIGANGAGKSNLFEFIKYFLASFSVSSSIVFEGLSAIAVFNKTIYLHIDIPLANESELQSEGFEVLRFKDSLPYLVDKSGANVSEALTDEKHELHENAYIFYSNIFDSREENYMFELVDISTNHLLNSSINDNRYYRYDPAIIPKEGIDSVTAFNILEVERQIEFLASNDHRLPFDPPGSVIVRIENQHNKFLENYSDSLKKSGLNQFDAILHKPWGNMQSEEQDDLKRIYRRLFIHKILIVLQLRRPHKFKKVTTEEFSDIIFNDNDQALVALFNSEDSIMIKGFLTSLNELIKVSSARKRNGKYTFDYEYHDIIETPLNKDTLTVFYRFFNAYKNITGEISILAFHWEGMSSGELAMLNLYSRFHYAFQFEVVNQSKHVVIMLDEAEVSLHPAWQIKLLDDLIIFLTAHLKEKSIQLIVASHSPFVISDLPKTMINFLDRNAEGNCVVVDGLMNLKHTFGANINTLYSDSFFMKKTLMGKFAKGKIDRLISTVNREREFDEEFPDWNIVQHYIDIIGEPLLRGFLQKQLNNNLAVKQKDLADLRMEIKSLETRIKKMEDQDGSN